MATSVISRISKNKNELSNYRFLLIRPNVSICADVAYEEIVQSTIKKKEEFRVCNCIAERTSYILLHTHTHT